MVTRKDLPVEQQAVQAIHAALESAWSESVPEKHPHLVLCGVKDETSLYRTMRKLSDKGQAMTPFFEPDRGNELTAIASGIVYDRRPFRRLQLLRGKNS